MSVKSEIREIGPVAFPAFTCTRVMMMPFKLEDVSTLPAELSSYRPLVSALRDAAPVKEGVAYLTIDEAHVNAGETHRRPGLHVDGVGPDGRAAGWGGGGKYGANGMIVAASHTGSRGWSQDFTGSAGPDGDCAHLAGECDPAAEVVLRGGVAYFCGALAVHESIPAAHDMQRQFVRLSMPSDAPWYEGYTANPTGIQPTGPIHARRAGMEYRV